MAGPTTRWRGRGGGARVDGEEDTRRGEGVRPDANKLRTDPATPAVNGHEKRPESRYNDCTVALEVVRGSGGVRSRRDVTGSTTANRNETAPWKCTNGFHT